MNRWMTVLTAVCLIGLGFWMGRTIQAPSEAVQVVDVPCTQVTEGAQSNGPRPRTVPTETPSTDGPPQPRPPEPKVDPPLKNADQPSPSSVNGMASTAATDSQIGGVQSQASTKKSMALNENVRPNFGVVLSESFRPSRGDELFARINGKYSGTVDLVNPTKHWVLNFELNGQVRAEKYSGNASVGLFEGPRRLAWKRESNSISMIRRSTPGSPWVILEISETYYAEMVFLDATATFTGNFYVKTGPGQFIHRGTVTLTRME